MRRYDAKPEDAASARIGMTRCGFAAGWGSRWDWRRAISPTADPARLDKEQYPREPNPTASWAPRTGHWSWVDGDFACRRKRSGRWPVEPARGRRYGYGGDIEPAGPVRLVRNRGQARPPPAGTSSRPTRPVRRAWQPLGVDARLVRRIRYEAVIGSAGAQGGLGPREPWRRLVR